MPAATLALAVQEGVRLFRATEPGEAGSAARHLHEHGFAVLLDALNGAALAELQATSAALVRVAATAEPGGNRGSRRWSLGLTTLVSSCLAVVDCESVDITLCEVWGGDRFSVLCTGGDCSLPGADSQPLHIDMPDRHASRNLYAYRDPMHPSKSFLDLPCPSVKVYFTLVDFDEETGPPRSSSAPTGAPQKRTSRSGARNLRASEPSAPGAPPSSWTKGCGTAARQTWLRLPGRCSQSTMPRHGTRRTY